MRSAFVKVRIEPELKRKAESLFESMGISPSEAVRMFYKQVEITRTIPFPIKVPNKETEEAIKAASNGEGITECKSTEDMFEKLEKYADSKISE